MKENTILIREKLKAVLKPSRYEHTLGVCYTAVCLAMRWGADLKKAETAGLLHDCAKYVDNRVIADECVRRGIFLSEDERKVPAVLHARLGAVMAREEYGISDEEILSAIESHSTGRPGMTLLEKIVFVADYIEPDRDRAPNLPMLRRLAFLDLDEALVAILSGTLNYLKSTGGFIDGKTKETYDYYIKNREEMNGRDEKTCKADCEGSGR